MMIETRCTGDKGQSYSDFKLVDQLTGPGVIISKGGIYYWAVCLSLLCGLGIANAVLFSPHTRVQSMTDGLAANHFAGISTMV